MRCPKLGFLTFVLSLLASSTPLLAQRAEKFVLGTQGAYVPAGGGTLIDDGWAAGGLLGVNFLPHVWLAASYEYLWLEGGPDMPRWDAQAVFGSLGYDIVPTGMNGNWIFYAGGGAVRFDPEAADLEKRTAFALGGGTRLIYDFSRHVAGSLEVGVAVAFAEESYIGGDLWLIPLGLGLTVRF
ncbi:MAG: outer membrane beta-barrel protein [Gemmatimonadetes bacterium]|uniref:Outer membrane beta-barrel protein n=1 Tax=Candidatus Kutchimonas denitrificans TaxID=3056748 RepID=A0AAE4ZD65_9BACT|nr:outer membrane beta-barrel protein [Gemmatimonadota bacterium]NIR75955.1 outer membrane beta-barrel protein [Candidatus Kutchimonas denitrificans]NIS02112.1 outer membrane beta-barrel protein [Gemmatimonadota bacterium]NIT67937.1 outer membrane beta-barrel protein [Gemmatimonadota bacterium]NIU53931.1 outer membrane beta-barrel protein [Gemmatimonadota bacterium]